MESDYIVYCEDGSRSAIASYLLLKNGHTVSYLEGGISKYRQQGVKDGMNINEPDNEPVYAEQPMSPGGSDHKPGGQNPALDGTESMIQNLLSQQQSDSDQLSNVLRTVLNSVMKELEQALKEKVEAEIAKNIAEQKLQAFMQGNIVNLVPAGQGKTEPVYKI